MKSRFISLLLASAMLLSMTSCSKKEQTLDVENMTLEEYIEAVELPKNLTISIDPATVEERETAKVYENVKFMDFDQKNLKEILLHSPVTKEDISAMGLSYVAKTDNQIENLVVHDNGEDQFGINVGERGIYGGFCYDIQMDNIQSAYTLTYNSYPQMYFYGSGKEIDVLTGFFEHAGKELEFSSRKNITNSAVSLFEEMGMPEMEIHEIVSYDIDVLQSKYDSHKRVHEANYQKALIEEPEYAAILSEEYPIAVPQKNDECYWVLCRQLIDGIPVNTYSTIMPENSPWAYVTSALQYTQDGLVSADFAFLVQQPKESDGTEVEILNAASALEYAQQYYGKTILLKPYDIESLELVYIEYFSSDGKTVSLKPYWLAKTSYQQDYPSLTDFEGNPLENEVKVYDYLYFDAVTGDLFDGSTSAQPYD